jgi:pyruvate kinase
METSAVLLQKLLPCETNSLEGLTEELLHVRQQMMQISAEHSGVIRKVLPAHEKSARNLLHYLAFRLQDVRELQGSLAEWGLSSLGRSERKVQAAIDTVLHVMHRLEGKMWQPNESPPACFREGRRLLEENTAALLGEHPSGRRVRIMVTMPTEAAHNYRLVLNLLESGMNCARINCAHDSPEEWAAIVKNIRKAEHSSGLSCKIEMDLAGPKLRTGPLGYGPAVIKSKPQRNAIGEVIKSGVIWMYPASANPQKPAEVVHGLAVPEDWLHSLRVGDKVTLTDARGAHRTLTVETIQSGGCLLSHTKTIYFVPGLALKTERAYPGNSACIPPYIPAHENPIRLCIGDLLLLRRDNEPGSVAVPNESAGLFRAAEIGCSIPGVLRDVKVGESIWFDDGKIGGIIEKITAENLQVRIIQARPSGEQLRSEKGINLPDSELQLPAFTAEDRTHLKFAIEHADMVGLSFVNSPRDVEDFIEEIRNLTSNPPGILLKIETRRGFDNLPALIIAAMQLPVLGVMIARGDLAIEGGFGRLSEVQEQILWVCEAAHVPVIWATQVLEGLAKDGLPTRAEVTDAAMGQRAECIMLNKGPHIVLATKSLDEILRRMQDHQTKKRSLLRRLRLAENFFANHAADSQL